MLESAGFEYSSPLFARFLREHVEFRDGAETKGTQLYDAYVARNDKSTVISPAAVGAILKKIGVRKIKLPRGVYYIGLALKDAGADVRQAAE